jgi:hypothetical protein
MIALSRGKWWRWHRSLVWRSANHVSAVEQTPESGRLSWLDSLHGALNKIVFLRRFWGLRLHLKLEIFLGGTFGIIETAVIVLEFLYHSSCIYKYRSCFKYGFSIWYLLVQGHNAKVTQGISNILSFLLEYGNTYIFWLRFLLLFWTFFIKFNFTCKLIKKRHALHLKEVTFCLLAAFLSGFGQIF